MARPQPFPSKCWVAVLIGALHLQLPTGTRAFLPSAPRLSERWSPTTHALIPFSLATAVDDWVFPWAAPVLPEEDNGYSSTLQQTSASQSLRRGHRTAKGVWKSSAIAKSPVWRPLESHVVVTSPSSAASSSYTYRSHAMPEHQSPYRVYCDLDGVLVDFCHGIRNLFPNHHASQSVDELNRMFMWQRVAAEQDFFGQLPWMDGGQRLWKALRPLQPDILTGVPARVQQSSAQKFSWCQRELGVPVAHIDKAFGPPTTPTHSSPVEPSVCRVITTWSDDKHVESRPGAVLIDDRLELRRKWEAKGGLFVHHSGCVDSTLEKLRYYGVLPDDDNDDSLLLP